MKFLVVWYEDNSYERTPSQYRLYDTLAEAKSFVEDDVCRTDRFLHYQYEVWENVIRAVMKINCSYFYNYETFNYEWR